MNFKNFTLVLLLVVPELLYSQTEYYATDTTRKSGGFKLVDQGSILNARQCAVLVGEKTTIYKPGEIIEYQLKDGRCYKSFSVITNNQKDLYFLEKIAGGKITLFYLKEKGGIKRYFLNRKESEELIEIPNKKKDYQPFLDTFTKDCPDISDKYRIIKRNKVFLKKYIKDYNICYLTSASSFTYGLSAGFATTRYSALKSGELSRMPSGNKMGYYFSAFTNIPLKYKGLSLGANLIFTQGSFSSKYTFNADQNEVLLNYISLDVPLLLRYTIVKNKVSPFFQAGPIYSHIINNEGSLYQYRTDGDVIYIKVDDSGILQNNLGGFSIGSGMVVKGITKHSWIIEANYSKLYNLQKNGLINMGEFRFGIGIIF
jgi:hypothetical protein